MRGDGRNGGKKGSGDTTNTGAAMPFAGSALGGSMLPKKTGVGRESYGGGGSSESGVGTRYGVDGGGDAMEDGGEAVIGISST